MDKLLALGYIVFLRDQFNRLETSGEDFNTDRYGHVHMGTSYMVLNILQDMIAEDD